MFKHSYYISILFNARAFNCFFVWITHITNLVWLRKIQRLRSLLYKRAHFSISITILKGEKKKGQTSFTYCVQNFVKKRIKMSLIFLTLSWSIRNAAPGLDLANKSASCNIYIVHSHMKIVLVQLAHSSYWLHITSCSRRQEVTVGGWKNIYWLNSKLISNFLVKF